MFDKLIDLKENDLSQQIIVPLLKKMFSVRVEFTGGGIEKGRDIIIYNKDEFGFDDYIGVQVKKIKATPNSSSNSFQQLLTQLEQMKKEGVIDPDSGELIKLRKLLFITPYPISDRSRDSHQGAFKEIIDKGVRIIDGISLSENIKKHAPELIKKLKDDNSLISEKIQPSLTNKSLMSALNHNNAKNLCDIYCETCITSGNSSNSLFENYQLINKQIKLIPKYLQQIIYDNEIISNSLNINLLDNESLKLAIEQCDNLSTIESEIDSIQSQTESIASSISVAIDVSKFKSYYPSRVLNEEFENFIFNESYNVKLDSRDKRDFISEIIEIQDSFSKRKELINSSRLKRSIKDEINVSSSIVFNDEVTKTINDKISEYYKIENINLYGLKNLLILCKKIENSIEILDKYTNVFKRRSNKLEAIKHKVLIDSVFDTSLNVIVLGEAGSGKTTNLQVYAQKLYSENPESLVFFMTLNKLSKLSSNKGDFNISQGLTSFLHEQGLTDYSESHIIEHLKNRKTKLILDSIDEAISEYPNIIFQMKEFSESYPNCQIITSSRFTVDTVSSLNFHNISLLPFDDNQKESFFLKWFNNDTTIVRKLVRHLKANSELNSIITNPLSATIMAVLQEGNVPLPNSESSLYRKRFELLSGVFDKFKGINRMNNQPDQLLSSARHLAFTMHYQKSRTLNKNDIVDIIDEKTYDKEKSESIFYELTYRAEILLSESDGTFGFGHLRFQEYLASEQLNNVRHIPLFKLITDNWWSDVYKLYSQHAHEIDWIINDSTTNDYAPRIKNLLKEMISNRVENERNVLLRRLEIAMMDSASQF